MITAVADAEKSGPRHRCRVRTKIANPVLVALEAWLEPSANFAVSSARIIGAQMMSISRTCRWVFLPDQACLKGL